MFKRVLVNVDSSVLESLPDPSTIEEELGKKAKQQAEMILGASEEDVSWTKRKDEHFSCLSWLPTEDLVLIYLRFYLGHTQSTIATIIKNPNGSAYSQSSITYKLKILKRKIGIVKQLKQFDQKYVYQRVFQETSSVFLSRMVIYLMRTLNQYQVAQVMGISQGKVRHLFNSLCKVFKCDEGMSKLFGLVSNWGYLGRESGVN